MTKNLLAQWSLIQRKFSVFNSQTNETQDSAAWTPNTDVYDGPDGLVIKVELAGIPRESIHIHLQEDAIVITGVRRDPYAGATGAGYRFRQMEIDYGPFQRVIPLPYPVSGSDATAICHAGILEVRLPRTRATVQHKIAIITQG